MTTVNTSELSLAQTIQMQYEFVRRQGTCNMFNRLCVQAVAESFGYNELAHVCSDVEVYAELLNSYKKPNPQAYAQWLENNGGEVFDANIWEGFEDFDDLESILETALAM